MLFADLMGNFGNILVQVLAVLGGVLAGGLLVGLAGTLTYRLAVHKPLPKPARSILRVLGGILGGVLVALWLNWGMGQGGLGGAVGLGGTGTPSAPPTQPATPEHPKPPTPEPKPAPTDEAVQVTMLGGEFAQDFQQGRRYRVEPQHAALTLAEVQDLIQKRRKQGGAELKRVDILIYDNSVAREDPSVRDLEGWVRANGLTPAVRRVAGTIPP
jgi:hypothetical protein